jgi:protocatechuate 3,4-dioxygenase beta subunit
MTVGRSAARRLLPVTIAIAGAAAALAVASAHGAARDCFSGSNPPNTLTLVAGSPQQGQITKPFQTNLQVTLANTDGCALTGSWAGISVVFTAPGSGPSGTFASTDTNVADVGTDANGTAIAPMFTANSIAGNYTVQAASSYGTVTLYLTNTATGVAASIAAAGTSGQSATIDSHYAQPLQVRVLDANAQPVAGVSVDFQLGTGASGAGAGFTSGGSQATVLTDVNGIATSPRVIANSSPGRFTATASTDGITTPVSFQLRNLAPRLTAVAKTESATVDGRYRRPLQLRALDAHSRPVEGITVTFALPQAATGANATFLGGASQATAVTNGQGKANSPALIANTTAGHFTATASIGTDAKPVSYTLNNLAGPPATITAGAASGESTTAGTRFPIPLAVTVTDKDGNAVPGMIVTFTAPMGRGPGGYFTIQDLKRHTAHTSRVARVRTDSKGVAVAPRFTANATVGGYAVTARAGGRQAAFALVNTPR